MSCLPWPYQVIVSTNAHRLVLSIVRILGGANNTRLVQFELRVMFFFHRKNDVLNATKPPVLAYIAFGLVGLIKTCVFLGLRIFSPAGVLGNMSTNSIRAKKMRGEVRIHILCTPEKYQEAHLGPLLIALDVKINTVLCGVLEISWTHRFFHGATHTHGDTHDVHFRDLRHPAPSTVSTHPPRSVQRPPQPRCE